MPGRKIDMVPHGVPDMPFLDPNFYKDRFDVEGRAVLLTFGLLSPNKGIENADSGAAAHFVEAQECGLYRRGRDASSHSAPGRRSTIERALARLWRRNGRGIVMCSSTIASTSPGEMAEFIGAADIYITPYRYEEQVVSGTLAYALGAGKAIISRLRTGTPLSY